LFDPVCGFGKVLVAVVPLVIVLKQDGAGQTHATFTRFGENAETRRIAFFQSKGSEKSAGSDTPFFTLRKVTTLQFFGDVRFFATLREKANQGSESFRIRLEGVFANGGW
jgi:hypothetical protein